MTLVHLILPNLTIGKFDIVMHALVAAIRDTSLNKLWGCARRAAMANQARTFAYGRQLLVRYHHVTDAMFDWLPNALWVLVSDSCEDAASLKRLGLDKSLAGEGRGATNDSEFCNIV